MDLRKYFVVLLAIGLVVVVNHDAYAQSEIGLKGLGARIGFAMPEDPIDNTIGFGAVAKLGTFSPVIGFDAFVDFWSKGYDVGGFQGSEDWTFTQIAFGAMAKYLFPSSGDIKPYAGGGLALHYGKSSWEWEYAGVNYDDSASDTEIGIHLAGGVEKALSPSMTGFAEAKYAIGGADYFFISVGAIFQMGG